MERQINQERQVQQLLDELRDEEPEIAETPGRIDEENVYQHIDVVAYDWDKCRLCVATPSNSENSGSSDDERSVPHANGARRRRSYSV